MKKVTHTKGNWHAVGAWIEHESDDVADIATFNSEAMGQGHLHRDYEEICANARLCAQAPAMLALLKDVLGYLDDPHWWPIAKRVDEIIFAAEGDES